MKRTYLLIVFLSFLYACNDGDVIVTTFNFDSANLETCGGPGEYVFFKINSESAESISVQLGTTQTLFVETDTLTVALDGTSNFVNYRMFSDNITSSYFCNNIPPTSPQVQIDYLASSGSATLTTAATLADDDGLDSDSEGTGDLDGDGLLNFYDQDDDGDNVPTADELDTENLDGDNNPLTNPLDTDGDGIPNHLDDDDDGDGILTRNEDADSDLDPTNDFGDIGTVPDYLNPNISVETIVNMYIEHTYSVNSDASLVLNNLILISGEEQITQETMDLGTILGVLSTDIIITPDFVP